MNGRGSRKGEKGIFQVGDGSKEAKPSESAEKSRSGKGENGTEKGEEWGNERYWRAVHTLMQWNETRRPLERWSMTTLAIQKLVGGRKEVINAYLETHEEEIKAHHARLECKFL